MSGRDKSYWLLSETSGIGETRDPRLNRHLPFWAGMRWLSAGWRDLWTSPLPAWHMASGFPAVGRLRVDAGRVRPRLHPVSRPRRLHDRRAVSRHWPL